MEEHSSQQEKWWESHQALGLLDTNPTLDWELTHPVEPSIEATMGMYKGLEEKFEIGVVLDHQNSLTILK